MHLGLLIKLRKPESKRFENRRSNNHTLLYPKQILESKTDSQWTLSLHGCLTVYASEYYIVKIKNNLQSTEYAISYNGNISSQHISNKALTWINYWINLFTLETQIRTLRQWCEMLCNPSFSGYIFCFMFFFF